jgi:hypothetical protein
VGTCNRASDPSREWRPGIDQAFALDGHNLLPGNIEAGSGQSPGLTNGRTLVLRVYDGGEDGSAARFGQVENDFADNALLWRSMNLQIPL